LQCIFQFLDNQFEITPDIAPDIAGDDKKCSKLIITRRTAVENGEGALDKESTSHGDLFEAVTSFN